MQAYMKSAMPYYGVPMPELRRITRRLVPEHPLTSLDAWRSAVLTLWRDATHREERYAAIELTGARPYRAYRTLDALPMYEELIVTGAWWDYVDAISHRLGDLLRAYPDPMNRTMRQWAYDEDLWKRRSAIVCQLGFKADTDLSLLYDCIAPNLADREFFIRKAIGWALRDYAWFDPVEVVRYVGHHEAELSPLSRREALKNVAIAPTSSSGSSQAGSER